MAKLKDCVQMIRSKNAGPFWLTIDLFCGSQDAYQRLAVSEKLQAESIAQVYQIQADSVRMFRLPDLNTIKISFPRKRVQGCPEDADLHGGQQYIPLLDLEV